MFLTPGMEHLLPPGHRGMVEFVLLSKLGSNQFEKLDETGTFEILHECFIRILRKIAPLFLVTMCNSSKFP